MTHVLCSPKGLRQPNILAFFICTDMTDVFATWCQYSFQPHIHLATFNNLESFKTYYNCTLDTPLCSLRLFNTYIIKAVCAQSSNMKAFLHAIIILIQLFKAIILTVVLMEILHIFYSILFPSFSLISTCMCPSFGLWWTDVDVNKRTAGKYLPHPCISL